MLLSVIPFTGPGLYEAVNERSVPKIAGCLFFIAALVLVTVMVARHRRGGVIDVTPQAVRLENIQPLNAPYPQNAVMVHDLPRAQVYDASYVKHSGNIVIRIRNRELIEFCPSSDPRVTQWLAQELRRALGLPT